MRYEVHPEDHNTYSILTDTTLCTGCETCVAACKEINHLDPHDHNYRWKRRIDDLSSTRFCTIIRRPGNKFIRQQCRHCEEPACVSACIVAALQKQPDTGAVTYDENRCMGCRYCMMACPYGIPRYSWEDTVPLVRKCILCHEHIKDGKHQPACTEACPYHATIFGTRAEMIEEANRRIAADPAKYTPPGGQEPKLWGYDEVGGVNVLYLSDVDLGQVLPWRDNLGTEPLPALTWQALRKVPPVVVGVAAAMGGIYWVIGRRMRLAAEAAGRTHASPPEDQQA